MMLSEIPGIANLESCITWCMEVLDRYLTFEHADWARQKNAGCEKRGSKG